MKEILNNTFVEQGMYVNPLEFNKGIIVARAFSPREYIKQNGNKSDAWLPEIIICEARDFAPIMVTGGGIIAKYPAKSYLFQLNPAHNKEIEKTMYKFEKAFIPEEKNEIEDIAVVKHDITGYFDNNSIRPGEISYSGISNRDIVLHGSLNDLEKMVLMSVTNLPKKSYNLVFSAPCCANSNKYYNIEISDEESKKFAKIVTDKLF